MKNKIKRIPLIDQYLLTLFENDLTLKLSNNEVVTFATEKEIKQGMLIFKKPPFGKCFLFILPNEQIVSFHTIEMAFPINIFFYNNDGKLDSSYLNVKPGCNSIKSKKEIKYAIEEPSKEK